VQLSVQNWEKKWIGKEKFSPEMLNAQSPATFETSQCLRVFGEILFFNKVENNKKTLVRVFKIL